jgi:hypothetical protein
MIHSAKNIKTVMRIIVTFTIVLLVLIIGYELTLLMNSNRTSAVVSSQEWISQRIAKDALLLQCGNADDKVQAVNELQTTLPRFESNHAQIATSTQPDTIKALIRASTVDYTDIDTAARKLLASSDKPADPVQVRIILDHERSYFLAYTQISALVQQYNTSYVILIFSIIIGAKIVLIGTNSFLLFLLEKRVIVSQQEVSPIHKENS